MTLLTLENTAIVVDSTCDPPPGYFDRPGLAMVPLKVHFGDETYRDGVDLSPPEFFAKLASSPTLPTTSQPTVGEFTAVYARLSREFEHIFALHLSSRMSGTYQASVTAAQPYHGIEVYDTRTVSGTISLLVERLRARLTAGVSLEEFHAYIERFMRESHMLFQVPTLEYLRRGGRIGRAQSMVGDVFGIRPIITVEDGELVAYAKVRGERRALETMTAFLSERLGLTGWVLNSNEGVLVEAEGEPERVAALVRTIGEAPPANATIEAIETAVVSLRGEGGFEIRASDAAGPRLARVLPDISTCPDCLRELFDPADRRYRYPFINCTHCGPRYSIIEAIPYDRARTSMRRFAMCPACRAEYDNPADRRFHAEPNGCPVCGPHIELWNAVGAGVCRDDEALLAAAAALRAGAIVAVKGLGGFHLLVNACDEAAVRRLRARKGRAEKPFAVMFPDLTAAAGHCRVGPEEARLLTGPAQPIVLLRRSGDAVAAAVAPGNPWLGALLPYTPLHHLLIAEFGFPVVATSGNISDEPIVTDECEAVERLGGIADLFLVHDRPIVRAVDDALARVVCGRELLLRRSRGYAPAPVGVAGLRPGILAFGGHLKNTLALTHAESVVLSQHVGDLETVEAQTAHLTAARDLVRLHAGRGGPRRARPAPRLSRLVGWPRLLGCLSSRSSITSPMSPPASPKTGGARRRLASPGMGPATARTGPLGRRILAGRGARMAPLRQAATVPAAGRRPGDPRTAPRRTRPPLRDVW